MDIKEITYDPSSDEILGVVGNKIKVVVDLPVVLEVDTILDKIGKHGIDSISKEEKDFLNNIN
jgi:hypothetical protein